MSALLLLTVALGWILVSIALGLVIGPVLCRADSRGSAARGRTVDLDQPLPSLPRAAATR